MLGEGGRCGSVSSLGRLGSSDPGADLEEVEAGCRDPSAEMEPGDRQGLQGLSGSRWGFSSASCEQWEPWDGEGFELCGSGETKGRAGLWLVECALE